MNSCVLMAEVISNPELRQTPDGTSVANMFVEFEGLRPEEPGSKIRAVGWGNLGEEISQQYHIGDRVVIEGRLSMNLIDMPEGYKEKRAELVISRIFPLGKSNQTVSSTPQSAIPQEKSSNVVHLETLRSPQAEAGNYPNYSPDAEETASTSVSTPGNYTNEQLDDIPF